MTSRHTLEHLVRFTGKKRGSDEILDDETLLNASFTRSAYQDGAVARKKSLRNDLIRNFGREEGIKEYEKWGYSPTYSNKRRVVWVNNQKKEVYIAYRGTKKTDVGDWAEDVGIAFGTQFGVGIAGSFRKLGKQHQDEINYFPTIRDHFAGYHIIVGGHSLGGSKAEAVMETYHDDVGEAHIFNKGRGIEDLIFGFKPNRDYSHVTYYGGASDVISAGGAMHESSNHKQINPLETGIFSGHSMDNLYNEAPTKRPVQHQKRKRENIEDANIEDVAVDVRKEDLLAVARKNMLVQKKKPRTVKSLS